MAIRCPRCGEAWPVVDGVPHFVSEDRYWGEIDQRVLLEILDAMENVDWKRALRERPEEQVQRAYGMMTNLERANWHLLAPVPADGVVLDVGAGSGANAHALALHYGHVVALEPVLERVRFMRRRFEQEGLANVEVIRGSAARLPFPAETFDLAVMNGVLEWMPWSEPAASARDVQRRTLESLRHSLKPGGWLYVGIENRMNPDYLLGAKDPHADIPWVTVLPRPLADWYSRRRTGEPYRTPIYTHRGYRSLLRDAGYGEIRFYEAAPSYNYPRYLIPCDPALHRSFREQTGMRPTSRRRALARCLLGAAGILPWTGYSFAIFARNPGKAATGGTRLASRAGREPSRVEAILRECALSSPSVRARVDPDRARWALASNFGEGESNVLVWVYPERDARPALLIKMSTTASPIDREFASLARLRPELGELVPEPLHHGRHRGYSYVAMEAVPGAPLEEKDGIPAPALEALIRFHDRTRTGRALEADEKAAALLQPLDALLAGGLSQPARSAWERYRSDLERALPGLPLEAIPQHGDFTLGNLIRGGGRLAIVDWEYFGRTSLPFYDLLCLFLSGRPGKSRTLVEALHTEPPVRRHFLGGARDYGARLGADPRTLGALFPALLAEAYARSREDGRSLADRLERELAALAGAGGAGDPARLIDRLEREP